MTAQPVAEVAAAAKEEALLDIQSQRILDELIGGVIFECVSLVLDEVVGQEQLARQQQQEDELKVFSSRLFDYLLGDYLMGQIASKFKSLVSPGGGVTSLTSSDFRRAHGEAT